MIPDETTPDRVYTFWFGVLSMKSERRGECLLRGERASYFLICHAASAQIQWKL
jgi:hypothetical protein